MTKSIKTPEYSDTFEHRPSLYDVRLADEIEEEDGIYEVTMVFSVNDANDNEDRFRVAQETIGDTFPFLPAPLYGVTEASGMERADFAVNYCLDIDQLRKLSQFVELEEMADIEKAVACGTPYIPDEMESNVADYLEDHPRARAFVESGLEL